MPTVMHRAPSDLPKLYWIITIPAAIVSLPITALIVLTVSYPKHIWTMSKRIITKANPYLTMDEHRS